jgi:hypothetical protein
MTSGIRGRSLDLSRHRIQGATTRVGYKARACRHWRPYPGDSVLRGRLERYVRGLVSNYKDDPRILAWDVYNEPGGFPSPRSEPVGDACLPLLRDVIDVCNRIPRYVTIELEQAGYSIVRSPLSQPFAWVHAIQIKEGAVTGGADPGADGMALSVPA